MDLVTATLVGSIVGGLLSGSFILDFWRMFRNRLRTKRIVNPNDDDLVSLCELQHRLFQDEIADNYDDMRRWLEEEALNKSQGELDLDDILV